MKKLKKFYNEISYAVIPFIIFILTLAISYFGNQLLYNLGVVKASNYPLIDLDHQIPYISWFVYFYYLTFPLGIITFFYLAYTNKKALYNMFITLVVSFAISGIIYLFAQTVFTKPDIEVKTFTDKLVVWTWGSTNPINCFPSQHCFMAFAMIIGCLTSDIECERKMNKLFKLIIIFCSIMIICSTVFIKQHFFLDILASFDIIFPVYALCYTFRVGEKILKRKSAKKQSGKNAPVKVKSKESK